MVGQTQPFLIQLQAAADQASDLGTAAQAQMQLIGKWIATCPVEFFGELRKHCPILKAPAFTLVTLATDVKDVLTLNDIFTTDLLKQNMLKFIGNTVVELPPSPEYERRKSILRLAFPMEDVVCYRNILLETSSQLLSNTAVGQPFDLVDYAKKLPAAAISQYLGLGELPVEKVVQWMHDINEGAVRNLANLPHLTEPAAAASAEVKPRIKEILERTRAALTHHKNPTVLERYLEMQSIPATYTSDEDIVSSLLFMMSACVDLTSTAITNVVIELMQRPAELQAAVSAAQQESDDGIAGYVWEALRFRQPSPGVINTCVQDYTLSRGTDYEQTIAAGTLVLGCSISAMHDPSVIDAPMEFRVGRPWHLAYTFFEAGLHTCHGKYFSMTQIPVAVKQLLRQGIPSPVDEFPINQGYPTQPFHIQFGA